MQLANTAEPSAARKGKASQWLTHKFGKGETLLETCIIKPHSPRFVGAQCMQRRIKIKKIKKFTMILAQWSHKLTGGWGFTDGNL